MLMSSCNLAGLATGGWSSEDIGKASTHRSMKINSLKIKGYSALGVQESGLKE